MASLFSRLSSLPLLLLAAAVLALLAAGTGFMAVTRLQAVIDDGVSTAVSLAQAEWKAEIDAANLSLALAAAEQARQACASMANFLRRAKTHARRNSNWRRPMRHFPMAIAVASTMLACACSKTPDNKTQLQLAALVATLPPEAATPCPAPVTLPDRAIDAAEVLTARAGDRRALRLCERKRAAAIASLQRLKPVGRP